jgi:hypothetical protein
MKRFGLLFCAVVVLLYSACGLLVEEGREVIAEVGGEPIRLNDLLREIRHLPFEERAKTNDTDESVRLAARRSVLERMVTEKLLAEEAKALGISVSDEEVELALEREERHDNGMADLMEGMRGGGGDHEHAHEGEGHSRTEINQMRERLMIQRMLMVELSEAALRKFYDEQTQEFRLSSPIVRYELLVVDASNSKVVDTVREKAMKEGTSLTRAFESLKDAPPTIFLGFTPPTPASNIVAGMREKVEKQETGQISEPFHIHPEGADQYGVAMSIGRIDRAPFDNVREQIYWKLYAAFLNDLKQKYEIVYHEDKLNYRLDR